MKNYHCCATCNHYQIQKNAKGTTYMCIRLGYETKPANQFNCWNPKPKVRELIMKGESSS